MAAETPTESADQGQESRLGRMGVRAFLALLLIATVCLLSGVIVVAAVRQGQIPDLPEVLKAGATFALGFYFGQKGTTPKA